MPPAAPARMAATVSRAVSDDNGRPQAPNAATLGLSPCQNVADRLNHTVLPPRGVVIPRAFGLRRFEAVISSKRKLGFLTFRKKLRPLRGWKLANECPC